MRTNCRTREKKKRRVECPLQASLSPRLSSGGAESFFGVLAIEIGLDRRLSSQVGRRTAQQALCAAANHRSLSLSLSPSRRRKKALKSMFVGSPDTFHERPPACLPARCTFCDVCLNLLLNRSSKTYTIAFWIMKRRALRSPFSRREEQDAGEEGGEEEGEEGHPKSRKAAYLRVPFSRSGPRRACLLGRLHFSRIALSRRPCRRFVKKWEIDGVPSLVPFLREHHLVFCFFSSWDTAPVFSRKGIRGVRTLTRGMVRHAGTLLRDLSGCRPL